MTGCFIIHFAIPDSDSTQIIYRYYQNLYRRAVVGTDHTHRRRYPDGGMAAVFGQRVCEREKGVRKNEKGKRNTSSHR